MSGLSERQRIALAAAVLFVLSAGITLLVLSAGARSRSSAADRRPQAAPGAAVSSGSAPAGPAQRSALSLGDFLLEEGAEAPQAPYLLRPRTPRWSEEQVERYWIPLKEVILDIVSRQSDRRIDEILEGVQ